MLSELDFSFASVLHEKSKRRESEQTFLSDRIKELTKWFVSISGCFVDKPNVWSGPVRVVARFFQTSFWDDMSGNRSGYSSPSTVDSLNL